MLRMVIELHFSPDSWVSASASPSCPCSPLACSAAQRSAAAPTSRPPAGATRSVSCGERQTAELLNLRSPPFTYNVDDSRQREQLIHDLWSGDYSAIAGRFTAANPMLVNLFEEQRLDEAAEAPRYRVLRGGPRFEAVLSALFRARSIKLVTLESATLAIQWLYYRVPSVSCLGWHTDVWPHAHVGVM